MVKEKLYAVVDAATESKWFLILEYFDPPFTCLYDESLPPELLKVAPYLVEVTEKLKLYLENCDIPWGIFLSSQEDMKTLRRHLRKYLQVLLPEQDKPVFFRFYDPRNIWEFLNVLSDWEIHCFMGPIDKIATNYQGNIQSHDFMANREQYPRGASSKRKLLSITPEQLEKIESAFAERYVQTLAALIIEWETIEDFDYVGYIRGILTELKNIGITDDHSVRGILKLFFLRRYLSVERSPTRCKSILNNICEPGHIRAERLLLQELGDSSVPWFHFKDKLF
ncbi:DUF4123 domain-containing protein [Photorhabdus laumondii]|uniref:DUF4123 domain-containing protein n=1 Tax=Photorhabdus laumondii subsp. clarkei TaxID=2029685 RepID=A0A329VMD4_9GAMM|nr:DUF4123 domain-containing protein [Photorhabdus laumondii]PQQ36815.1 DUF4123 domain-containing protein [Photorhabdus luminescens]RAW93406.1 hypothetical protein CKY01_00270 [Photorhabdus laumondii subsp. clarkei]